MTGGGVSQWKGEAGTSCSDHHSESLHLLVRRSMNEALVIELLLDLIYMD